MSLLDRTSLRLFLLPVFLASAGVAWAQVSQPSSTQPGRVGESLSLKPELPEVKRGAVIALPEEKGQAPGQAKGPSFTLKEIRLEGNTVLTEADLRPDYAEYIGRQVTLDILNLIADRISAHYRNAGYILSVAVVPPQEIGEGVATIRVVEGFIGQVKFQGRTVRDGVLQEYADHISQQKPLSSQALERYLLLMQDLPGMTARAVLQPSADTPGASDLLVMLTEKHFDGAATLDNRGTRYLGPVQAGATINGNDLLGFNEQTQLHGVSTAELNEMHYGQLLHQEQLDGDGTKLTFSASRTNSAPAYKLATVRVQGTDTDYNLAVSHPFIRSRQDNWYGTVTLDARETTNDELGTQFYHDSLRILRLDSAYDFTDRFSGVNRLEGTVSKGFGWDTSEGVSTSRSQYGHPEFTKGSLQMSRLQTISGRWSAYAAFSGQAAADTLLAAEEFGLGGASSGSAYDPSELTGDAGIALRAELRYSREGDWDIIPAWQIYGFYDIGKVWIRDQGPHSDTASLADFGFGVRFNVLEPVSGSLELAEPLTKPVAALGQDGHQPRVFFSLAYRY